MKQQPMLTVINQIIDASGQREAFETDKNFHLVIANEPYMDLVIEAWDAVPSYNGEKRHISVAHYFKQNGDRIADPEIVMGEHGFPHQFTQWTVRGARCHQIYWNDENGKTLVDLYQRQDTLSFMRMWARNIREQGFVRAAKAQAKAAA